MLFEMIVIGGIAYYGARRFVQLDFKLKPHAIAETLEQVRTTAQSAVEQVQKQTVSRAEWEERKARANAKALYDRTIGDTFQKATEEEKDTILQLFQKYMPSDK